MDAPSTPASAERHTFSEADFLDWLDETSTPALISTSHDRYYAFCVEFGVAGTGATEDEAVRDATSLLMRYLTASFSEGRAYRDSKKSPPLRVRLRSWYLIVRTKFLRHVKPSLSRLGGLISVPMTDRDTHGLVH
jgi:predicted RNase H-like HicB family nuclease